MRELSRPSSWPISIQQSESIPVVALVALLGVILGLNFVAMKLALRSAGPITIAAAGAITGGASMLALARLSGEREHVNGRLVRSILPVAISVGVVSQLGFALGLERIDASAGSILISTTPILTALLGWWILKESTSGKTVFGIVLAFAGTGIMATVGQEGARIDPIGIGFMLLAALGWAAGLVLTRKIGLEIAPASLVAWQTILSVPVVFLLAWAMEGLKVEWTWMFLGIIAYQGALPRGLSFVIQRYIMLRGTTLQSSLVAFLIPLLGSFFGVTLLSEVITKREVIGAIAILTGLALVLGSRDQRRIHHRPRPLPEDS